MSAHSNARHALLAGAAIVGAISFTSSAQAALMVSYNGGAPITDNGAGDSDPTSGSIVNSTVVGGFGVAITVAASNSPGTSSIGLLQVQSLDVHSIGASVATLHIAVSDTGFASPGTAGSPLLLSSSYGTTLTLGAAGDKTVFTSFADPSNAQPAVAVATLPLTATKSVANLTTESYSGLDTAAFIHGPTAYSLGNTIDVTLSPGGQANISGTTAATVAPEPTTLAALGAASLLFGRRRRA